MFIVVFLISVLKKSKKIKITIVFIFSIVQNIRSLEQLILQLLEIEILFFYELFSKLQINKKSELVFKFFFDCFNYFFVEQNLTHIIIKLSLTLLVIFIFITLFSFVIMFKKIIIFSSYIYWEFVTRFIQNNQHRAFIIQILL